MAQVFGSLKAKETARAILGQLDSRRATPAARRALLKILTDIGHTGQLDADRLEAAVFDVFEPGSLKIRPAVGHPAAPLMVESVIEVMKARLHARSCHEIPFISTRPVHVQEARAVRVG